MDKRAKKAIQEAIRNHSVRTTQDAEDQESVAEMEAGLEEEFEEELDLEKELEKRRENALREKREAEVEATQMKEEAE